MGYLLPVILLWNETEAKTVCFADAFEYFLARCCVIIIICMV